MAAPRPMPAAPPGLLDEDGPSKWDQIKQILWESNLNAPVRGAYNLMNTPAETLLYDNGAAGEQAVADAFDAAGGVTVGSAMIPKPSNAMAMGIKAYHGSPHSFDKFDMSKIGTGEGAQAYGHGLYFAENEGVARGYRDALTNRNVPQGKHIEKVAFNVVRNAPDRTDAELAPFVRNVYPDATDAEVSDALKVARANQQSGSMYEVSINADPAHFLDWDKPLSEQPEAVRRLAGWTPETEAQYKAALKSDTDSLYNALVGDSQYSPAKMPRPAGSVPFDSTGERLYQSLTDRMGAIDWPDNATADVRAQYRKSASERAAEKLKEAGIPGIKYLDAGSRGRGVAHVQPMYKGQPYGDPVPATAWNQVEQLTQRYKDMGYDVEVQDLGTRNYVVFDDSLIDIIKKYGIAGLLGSGAMYGMSDNQAQAGER